MAGDQVKDGAAARGGLPAAPEGVAIELLRKVDWAATRLGPPEGWPDSLRVALSMVLNSPESMYLAWGEELTFLFNDAYAPMLGPRVDRAMGRPFREVWSDVWDQIGALVEAVFAGGAERFVDLPLSMARRGVQEETYWTFSFSPVRDAHNRVVALLCVTNEQTGRVEKERSQHASNAALREDVARGLANLSAAEEQLRQSQKLEAIGQLTGGVAHDFNNLLTVIRGSVELLQRPDVAPARRERYLAAVGDAAERATALTQQLLAFARRQALKPEAFDVGASLGEVKAILDTLVGSRIELELVPPRQQVFALADRSQFDTAIVNMAINARDAMHGEGRLVIAAGPVSGVPAIRQHPPVTGDFIAVTVADTGGGIASDQIGRIFEPFYTTKAAGAGTGLGLSQVFGFAKQSGGDLRVQSPAGEGATFTLYLPRTVADQTAAAPEPEVFHPDDEGEGVCVLLVEDNQGVGRFAADALKTLGYDCVLTSDGEEALAALEADGSRFQVVFSDVVMPGMGGLELGDTVRDRFPDIPVILTSGYSHVLAQNGHHGFELLHKPYSMDQLSRALRKAVAWHARRAPRDPG